MADLKTGDKVKNIRRTFLHNGIFIHQNTTVEILEVNGENVKIRYIDMEGHPHEIEGFKTEDLEASL